MNWNIGYITKKRALLSPDKLAVCFADSRDLTYKELNDEVNQVAHFFQDKGLKKGDRISVLLTNCPEFLVIYFAAAKLGLILVPLNFRLVGPELEYQLNDCGCRLLIFHDSLVNSFEDVRDNIKVEEDKFICLESGDLDTSICPDWAYDYSEAMKNFPVTEPELEDPVGFDDPLAIIYTAGTTGNPKGAVVSHEQTYFKNFQIACYSNMRSDDVYLAHVPLFHSGGLFVVSTPALCAGATMATRKRFDAEGFAEDIENYKATIVIGLTTMWRFILETGRLDHIDSSSIRVVMGGGERTPMNMFDELGQRGLQLQSVYGQTENSCMMMLPKEDVQRKQGSIGRPGFFTEIWIQNSDGKKLPPNEIGEIVASGPTVMSGYWNMPDKTDQTIIYGVLHTGDLGYTDDEGYFYIVDRERDMYRSGGENVYPAEVEKILDGHPKVLNVAIIGVPDERWGETGMAFIVPTKKGKITKEEMSEFLKGKVARYKFPSQIKFLDELPLTGMGKVKKVELKKKYGARLDE